MLLMLKTKLTLIRKLMKKLNWDRIEITYLFKRKKYQKNERLLFKIAKNESFKR